MAIAPDPSRAFSLPPGEVPLGIQHPLGQPMLQPTFMTPLGTRSLTVLNPAVFLAQHIPQANLQTAFQDSPFFEPPDAPATVAPPDIPAAPDSSSLANQPSPISNPSPTQPTSQPRPTALTREPVMQRAVEDGMPDTMATAPSIPETTPAPVTEATSEIAQTTAETTPNVDGSNPAVTNPAILAEMDTPFGPESPSPAIAPLPEPSTESPVSDAVVPTSNPSGDATTAAIANITSPISEPTGTQPPIPTIQATPEPTTLPPAETTSSEPPSFPRGEVPISTGVVEPTVTPLNIHPQAPTPSVSASPDTAEDIESTIAPSAIAPSVTDPSTDIPVTESAATATAAAPTITASSVPAIARSPAADQISNSEFLTSPETGLKQSNTTESNKLDSLLTTDLLLSGSESAITQRAENKPEEIVSSPLSSTAPEAMTAVPESAISRLTDSLSDASFDQTETIAPTTEPTISHLPDDQTIEAGADRTETISQIPEATISKVTDGQSVESVSDRTETIAQTLPSTVFQLADDKTIESVSDRTETIAQTAESPISRFTDDQSIESVSSQTETISLISEPTISRFTDDQSIESVSDRTDTTAQITEPTISPGTDNQSVDADLDQTATISPKTASAISSFTDNPTIHAHVSNDQISEPASPTATATNAPASDHVIPQNFDVGEQISSEPQSVTSPVTSISETIISPSEAAIARSTQDQSSVSQSSVSQSSASQSSVSQSSVSQPFLRESSDGTDSLTKANYSSTQPETPLEPSITASTSAIAEPLENSPNLAEIVSGTPTEIETGNQAVAQPEHTVAPAESQSSELETAAFKPAESGDYPSTSPTTEPPTVNNIENTTIQTADIDHTIIDNIDAPENKLDNQNLEKINQSDNNLSAIESEVSNPEKTATKDQNINNFDIENIDKSLIQQDDFHQETTHTNDIIAGITTESTQTEGISNAPTRTPHIQARSPDQSIAAATPVSETRNSRETNNREPDITTIDTPDSSSSLPELPTVLQPLSIWEPLLQTQPLTPPTTSLIQSQKDASATVIASVSPPPAPSLQTAPTGYSEANFEVMTEAYSDLLPEGFTAGSDRASSPPIIQRTVSPVPDIIRREVTTDSWSSLAELYESTLTSKDDAPTANKTETPEEANGYSDLLDSVNTVAIAPSPNDVQQTPTTEAPTATPATIPTTATTDTPTSAQAKPKASPEQLERLAQEIYRLVRQRLALDRERNGHYYSGRLF